MKTVLLDGFCGNHSRMGRMARTLSDESGHVCQILRYDSSGRTEIGPLGARLAESLGDLKEPFHAVGYSMGGLVIREALRQSPDLPLRRAVFLHTPHRGTWMGQFLGLPAVRQIRPGSPFLQQLAQATWSTPTLNIWCPGDLIVVPGWQARWEKATVEECCHVPGHVWPLFSKNMHQRIAIFLKGHPHESTECGNGSSQNQ
ncbi:MAG: hypothetical protein SFU85_05320 [Candidatus Methylacidiphilales bacterium]|nr:hypothetical protein [Candidatus Methylacidiphilales bacterium]